MSFNIRLLESGSTGRLGGPVVAAPLSGWFCPPGAPISAGSVRAAASLHRVHRAGGGGGGGGGGQMAGWGGFFFSLLNYKTEKYVIAENRRIGILFRIYQLAVLGYIIG